MSAELTPPPVSGLSTRAAQVRTRRAMTGAIVALCSVAVIGLSACSSGIAGGDRDEILGSTASSGAAKAVGDSSCPTSNPVASTTYPLGYTGTVQTVTVPDGVCAVVMVNVIGGGGGKAEEGNKQSGAAGALVNNVVVAVSPGDQILVWIGGAGEDSQSQEVAGSGGLGGLGGNGGPGGVSDMGGAAGGGGATTVQIQHGTDAPQTIVVAGGAGGGSTGLAVTWQDPSYEGVPGGNAGTNGPTTSGGFMIWQGNKGQNGGGGWRWGAAWPASPRTRAYGGIGGNGIGDSAGSGGGGWWRLSGRLRRPRRQPGRSRRRRWRRRLDRCGHPGWIAGYSSVGHASGEYGGKNGTAGFAFIQSSS